MQFNLINAMKTDIYNPLGMLLKLLVKGIRQSARSTLKTSQTCSSQWTAQKTLCGQTLQTTRSSVRHTA